MMMLTVVPVVENWMLRETLVVVLLALLLVLVLVVLVDAESQLDVLGPHTLPVRSPHSDNPGL